MGLDTGLRNTIDKGWEMVGLYRSQCTSLSLSYKDAFLHFLLRLTKLSQFYSDQLLITLSLFIDIIFPINGISPPARIA